MSSPAPVHIIGGGLAGCEAAFQLASRGVPAVIHEMRPVRETAAHRTDALAELALAHRSSLRPPIAECVEAGRKVPAADAGDILRLEQLLAAVDLAEQAAGADVTGVNPAVR